MSAPEVFRRLDGRAQGECRQIGSHAFREALASGAILVIDLDAHPETLDQIAVELADHAAWKQATR